MKQENFFTANPDLLFTFEHVVPWGRVVPLIEENFADANGPADTNEAVDLYREALSLVGEYAGTEIAGRAKEVDEAGSTHHNGHIGVPEGLQRNLDGLKELGVTGLSVPRAYGGESFPFTVSSMALEMISRGCASTMVQYAFFLSPAMMLLRFAPEALKRQYVPRLAAGEISGSVAMTEPQAGSDVGRVATTARPTDDGCWRITGRKQFITNGIGDVCIVLARSEAGSSGLDGMSLFLVERRRDENGQKVDNYVVERAESKICITASVTCGLAFEESHAVLLGKRGEGWREILTFMNESRVAVGIQGIGTAQAAFEEARQYAGERVQMGRPIREHPIIADMLLDMEASIAGLRALAYEATALYDETEGLRREAGKLPEGGQRSALEARAKRKERYLRELTPLVKWYGAEEVIHVCRMAMQIHGGYGVIKEYDIERLMRDSLILPIYEGTSQIQALMATKDLLKAALARPTALVAGTISPSLARSSLSGELGSLYRRARSDLSSAIRWLLRDLLKQGGKKGLMGALSGRPNITEDQTRYILMHAERLAAMLSHVHAARLVAEQSQHHPERRQLAIRLLQRAVRVAADGAYAIKSGDRSTLEAIDRSAAPV